MVPASKPDKYYRLEKTFRDLKRINNAINRPDRTERQIKSLRKSALKERRKLRSLIANAPIGIGLSKYVNYLDEPVSSVDDKPKSPPKNLPEISSRINMMMKARVKDWDNMDYEEKYNTIIDTKYIKDVEKIVKISMNKKPDREDIQNILDMALNTDVPDWMFEPIVSE